MLKHLSTTRRYLVGFLMLSLLLTGCGFKMRGQTELPFGAIYSNISRNSSFGIYIYRLLKASSPNTVMVDSPQQANIIVTQLALNRTRTEISLDADGRVEEYELGLAFQFSVSDAAGNILIEPTTLTASQLLPYDEDVASAKAAEMVLIYNNMEKSIADRLYRRITSEELSERYRQLNPSN